jgi:hypothetical protein
MVEVFKTNINESSIAAELTAILNTKFPKGRINFDLDDCDRILRIESEKIVPTEVISFLSCRGYYCEVLE